MIDYKRIFYEYHCWLAGGANPIGFYDFLRNIKGFSYRRLNLDSVVDDATAEQRGNWG